MANTRFLLIIFMNNLLSVLCQGLKSLVIALSLENYPYLNNSNLLTTKISSQGKIVDHRLEKNCAVSFQHNRKVQFPPKGQQTDHKYTAAVSLRWIDNKSCLQNLGVAIYFVQLRLCSNVCQINHLNGKKYFS